MAERYKIYEKLGVGGNGAVYRAYDGQLKRWVAIKRLLSASEAESNDPMATELRKEADTLASLRNANIVTIFDVSTDAEGLFIVMELLEGPDLSDAIAHGPLMLDDFKQLAEQTLEALLVAHQHRVLHRDIKPENIKVERLPGGRLQAKIIDFGLARAGFTARKQTEDQDGSVMGSIYYMAPEQLSREATDARTDLYALGCVFYEALSSRKAFDGKDVMDVIDKHIDHEYTPLAVICPYLPQWLTYWVNRLMARQPDDRPASAQQAIEEFRAWEKLPAQPGVAPWMPMQMYQPAYGYAPQPHYPTGNVPVQTTGYYPVPSDTTAGVPVIDPYASQPIPVAIAIPEKPVAAPGQGTQQLSRAPQRPGPRPAGASKPAAGATKSAAATSSAASKLGSVANKKHLLMGAGALLVIVLGVTLMGGKKGDNKSSSGGGGTPSSSSFKLNVGNHREDLYPSDRSFLQPDPLRALHVMAKTGTRGFGNDASGKPGLIVNGGGNRIGAWDDLSKRGGNNMLRSPLLKTDNSPEKTNWTVPEETIKGDRKALYFRTNNSMSYSTADAKEADWMPFGTVTGAFRSGLTVAIVFSASSQTLPGRVLRLATPDVQSEVSLRVMQNHAIRATIKSSGKSIDLESSGLDGTQPCFAILTWSGETSEVVLRTREARGITHKTEAKKQSLPGNPLSVVTLGSYFDTKSNSFSNSDKFEGKIAELVVFSTALNDGQCSLVDKELREYYFQSKPGSSNPQKNKDLSEWSVGEEKTIFNGKDLSGWNFKKELWSVEDGAITGKGMENPPEGYGNGRIYWDQGTVKDFQLSLKFKANGWSSNIYYRANIVRDTSTGAELNGYQARIDLGGGKIKTGGLSESGGRNNLVDVAGKSGTLKDDKDSKKVNLALKDNALGTPQSLTDLVIKNEWNDYVIKAEGNHLVHIINGKPFMDVIDEGHAAITKGVIGFELSIKGQQKIQFKDIKLKRLR